MGGGMKSGSGDDPFADVDTDEDTENQEETDATTEIEDDSPTTDSTDSGTEAATVTSSTGLPWKYSRDSAKSNRDMVQFFLQSETQQLEGRAQSDLEAMLDENVLLLDIREAAYQVALEQHLNDVAAQLREWGYDAE